jgi:phosphatidylglycerophosphate synthase
MKKIILRYGAYGALLELIIFLLIALVIWLFDPSHKVQGYIGWVNLICPLLFVYFGIRYFRDHSNKGELSFMTALKIGLLISLIPAFAFALIETIFVIYIEPDFYEKVSKFDLEEYRKVLSPEAFSVKEKEVKEQLVLSNNPVYNFGMMMLTITALGTIVTVISSLILYKKTAR